MILFAAAVSLGLMAGLFFAFANAVMPALRGADDGTVTDVMRRINASIQNPLFGLLFAGTLVLTAVAAVQRPGDPGVLIGLVLYLATLVITVVVHLPLNNRLDRDGDRAAFFDRWVRFNHLRTLTCVGAFAAVVWSLVAAAGRAV